MEGTRAGSAEKIAVTRVDAGGEDDHRQVGQQAVAANVIAQRQPVHTGQAVVEQHECKAARRIARQHIAR